MEVLAKNRNEKVLISELKNGSERALDAIYCLYAKRLYAYSLQYVKFREDAEEIVEDVFVRLWNNRKMIRQKETLRSLLFIMAKNQLINAYRARINEPHFEDFVRCSELVTAQGAERKLDYEDFVFQLNQSLTKLPKLQQQIIRLSKEELLNNGAIAERLSLSEQTVKNQLSLGLKALKRELKNISLLSWVLLFVNF